MIPLLHYWQEIAPSLVDLPRLGSHQRLMLNQTQLHVRLPFGQIHVVPGALVPGALVPGALVPSARLRA